LSLADHCVILATRQSGQDRGSRVLPPSISCSGCPRSGIMRQ
jgi:hypothetical protein